jgi:hypothetical protein
LLPKTPQSLKYAVLQSRGHFQDRVNWRKLIRQILDARSINPLAGVMIFAMLVVLPLTRVFFPPKPLRFSLS